MAETETAQRRGRRGGGRDARRQMRSGGGVAASPYITRGIPPVDILTDEAAEIIEANAETILEERSVSIFWRMPRRSSCCATLDAISRGSAYIFPEDWRASFVKQRRPALPSMPAMPNDQSRLAATTWCLHLFTDRLSCAICRMSADMPPLRISAIL